MSETILKALMQLCALVVKQDTGVLHQERNIVELFLKKLLRSEAVSEYMQLFDRYTQRQAEETLTPVGDSVRVLKICQQINARLTHKQKVIAWLRLVELLNATPQFSEQRVSVLTTIADVFQLATDECRNIRAFVTATDAKGFDHADMLTVSRSDAGYTTAKNIIHSETSGLIAILRVASADLYFVRGIEADGVRLNQTMLGADIHLFAGGSALRFSHGGAPVYYGDVVSRMMEGNRKGRLTLEAKDIGVVFPNGTVGLHHISFAENHGQLIGIMGASGSGKTTLLNVLCGMERPTTGKVLINGFDLHREKEALEGIIGYIPQDDLLIEELTVFDNLYYNARLCFRDKSPAELEEVVSRTLTNLGLYERKDLKVGSFLNKTISGGQRKRLNIALELLREPSILFVDEPTSGLSSSDSENVMDLMRDLAMKGKQVYVVIHQPSSEIFKMFDKMIVLDTGGYMIYHGNPIEAVMYFKRAGAKLDSEEGECPVCGNVNPEVMFNIVEEQTVDEFGHYTGRRRTTPREWEERFAESRAPQEPEPIRERPPRMLNVPGWLRQLRIFFSRDFFSKLSNRQYLLLTLLEAPALAFILAYVIRYIADPLSNVYIFRENENIPIFIFMSLIVALFLGLIVSAEEIFRDRKILKREAFLHLSRSAYLVAKISILVVISAVQCLLFVAIANCILEVREMYFAYWLALFSTAVAANIMGLIISDTFNSAVTIYIVIPLLMIPMMVLSGAMFSFDKLNRSVSSVDRVPLVAEFMPTRWSYEALMVHQYCTNRFETYFYQIEKRESNADFRQAYLIPALQERYELCAAELAKSGKVTNHTQALTVIRNEVAREISIHPDIQFDLSLLTPDTFNETAAEYLNEFIEAMNVYYMKLFAEANGEKEQLIAFMLKEDEAKYKALKNAYHNEHLSEMVRKVFEKNKILEYDGRLIQGVDPIYQDPEPDGKFDFRTHFFAPRKYFAGRLFDTYNFNIFMIWLFSIIGYVLLYTGLPKKMMIFLGNVGRKKNLAIFVASKKG